jgi:hypothetical protein
LRTGRIILCFSLLNVADRSHNIMILGHVKLHHTIPCSGTTQMHNWHNMSKKLSVCTWVHTHNKCHREQGYKYPTQHTTNKCLNKHQKDKQLNNKHR